MGILILPALDVSMASALHSQHPPGCAQQCPQHHKGRQDAMKLWPRSFTTSRNSPAVLCSLCAAAEREAPTRRVPEEGF